jgi:hypothetical protein
MTAGRPLVVWFTNQHDQSLHYLKFGLMQMARQGEIRLQERPTATAEGWLTADLRQRHYRRIVLVGLEWRGERRLVAVDGEDSPFQLSDLIERVDRYYTCTYCPHLFHDRRFLFALPWQSEAEIEPYRQRFEELVSRYGHHFAKVRPWAPIGPDLEWPRPRTSWPSRKLANLRHKIQLSWRGTVDWGPQFERFSARWASIQNLRNLTPSIDVVLQDSLWGWPRHRIALHHQLAALADQGYAIRSRLGYRQPEPYELGDTPPPDPATFPMQLGKPIAKNYESLLAASRLGVFATGFHYGWRNIVTLAWALGLKTLQDPFTYTFLFDAGPFHQPMGPDGWDGLRQVLDQARLEAPAERQIRWKRFDQVAAPKRVAAQVVEQIASECL